MNKRDTAGLIYDYVVTGRNQADIAADYDTDQWGGVSGTLMRYGFYDGTRGGYKRRFSKGLHGLTVTEGMIYDYLRQWEEGDGYYFEDFVKDNYDTYAKKQKVGPYAPKPKTTATKSTGAGRSSSGGTGRSTGYTGGYGGNTGSYQPTYTYTPPQKSAWEIQQEQEKEAKEKRYDSVIRSYNAQKWDELIHFCNVYSSNNLMDTPEMWFYYGYAYHRQGYYDKAVEAYRKYLHTYPTRENVTITRSNIAYCLAERGRKKEALEELRYCQNCGYAVENLSARIKALDEELNRSSTKEQAKRYYNEKNYAKAYALLRPLVTFGSSGDLLYVSMESLDDLMFQFAYAAADTGHDKEAQAAYSRYLSTNPHEVVAYNNRANIYHKWGWYESELKDLEKVWSMGERRWNVESRLQEVRGILKAKEEKAKEDAKFRGDMAYLEQCFNEKKYELVCKTAEAWKTKGRNIDGYLFKYAYALAEVGRDDESLTMYGSYIQKYPKDTAPLNNRAIILERKGRLKEALADLEKAYSLGQRDFNIDGRLARVKQKIKDAEEEVLRLKRLEEERKEALRQEERRRAEEELRRLEEERKRREEEERRKIEEERRRLEEERRRAEEERKRREEAEFLLLMM